MTDSMAIIEEFLNFILASWCLFVVYGDEQGYVRPNPYRAREMYGLFNYSGLHAHINHFLMIKENLDPWASCSVTEEGTEPPTCTWSCDGYGKDHPIAYDLEETRRTIETTKTPITSECYPKLGVEEELSHPDNPKVLCVIATYKHNHEMAKISAMTWGRECSGFLAISEFEDESIPTVKLGNIKLEEGYWKLWQKKVHMYSLVWTFFREDFDFFFFCDDDTYILSHTMYPYLRDIMSRGHNTGLYAGRRFRRGGPETDRYYSFYNSGGAGYILDQISLGKLYRTLNVEKETGQSACAGNVSRYEDLPADVSTSQCLRAAGIFPTETKDCAGKDRFHHVFGYDNKKAGGSVFHTHRCLGFREGRQGISQDSITFHNVKDPPTMVGLYRYLRMCP